jgi:predicted kinase
MQELVVMAGLPASGKSTLANEYREGGYAVVSSDEMRAELFGDVNVQENNVELFEKMFKRVRLSLSEGKSIVLDATNVVSKRRINTLKAILTNTKKDPIRLDRNNIRVKADLILCPYNECIDRNKSRERKVPSHVIEKMYKQWQTPMLQEGFDEIVMTYTSETNFETIKEIDFLKQFPQFNPNHSLSIGHHCQKVGLSLREAENANLQRVGYLHDIGKLFCMGFKDANGRKSEIGHFYGHESVSAYDSFFFDRERYSNVKDSDRLEISQLITWHMLPHRLDTEKSINKYKDFFGEKFWNDLMLLAEADNNGR